MNSLNSLLAPLLELDSYQKLLEQIRKGITPVLVSGVIDVQKTHLMYAIEAHLQRPIVILTYNELRAKAICEDLRFFTKNYLYYPAKDLLFYSADVHSTEINRQRFVAIEQLMMGNHPILVASAEAFLDRYPKEEVFRSHLLKLQVGDVYEIEELTKKLVYLGYERAALVESPGQFAVRGGILDVFALTAEEAVRIEFWDDEIDSIRSMDVQSQRSLEQIKEVTIFPMRELVYDAQQAQKAADRMEQEYKKALAAMQKSDVPDGVERLQEQIGENIEKLRTQHSFPSVGTFINYFYEDADTVSLFSYLPKDSILLFDEPQRIHEHLQTLCEEYAQSIRGRIIQGFLLSGQSNLLFDQTAFLRQTERFSSVLFSGISQRTPGFVPKAQLAFSVKGTPSFDRRVDLFCEELSCLRRQSSRILIVAGTLARAKHMAQELTERGLFATYMEDLSKEMPAGCLWVTKGSLSRGFQYDFINLAVFSANEIFGSKEKRKKRKTKRSGDVIKSFADLHIGDYVVHDAYGIGVFRGLEKIKFQGVQKEYLKISYQGGDNLFLSVNQLETLQKYIGSGGNPPKLSKMGGKDWEKAKAKARKAVKILAEDLVGLYAKRAAAKGYVYGPDTTWQTEFEESFPYEETEDQLAAIADVKRDMQSEKVMDRLICGDVGYGKTEIAIRAAFKAVQDGKQVAYLVPTTILAQQHYNTFVQRMANYPVQIELLSRFRTPKKQKESIQKLEKGLSDIVIGTHRLLSKDVQFHDLGLIIVDEEQRFGVSHKEKLKRLRENVDVLTLTATPIPRTLHMSLSGIRDMSILEEPPQERRPVQTYVMENNPEFIREAIHRELSREGQVYYLYNRVDSILQETAKVQQLAPEAVVAYAHGQMSERELEGIMQDFISGEIDVLVCTTIIETGLDIPNVNTIIIQDADRMGLSQLYQLRGRVGRSSRTSYAYLMYQRNKMLKEVAEKRLQTIRDFTEFGSGFQVAMRDLELRGAGNLLGAEQHGHMELVGYDMYCRLLEDEVQQLRGIPVEERFETTMDLPINAFLPEFYIRNQEQRIEMYKKIATIQTEEDFLDLQDELLDRYGDLPKSVQLLLEIALRKAQAHRLGILSIQYKAGNVMLKFQDKARINQQKLQVVLKEGRGRYLYVPGANPAITIRLSKQEEKQMLDYITFILQGLKP